MLHSKFLRYAFLILLLLPSCIHFHSNSKVLNKKITIIAHRGASGYLPEHTLASAALAHGFDPDFIEPDLVVTKDNHLIVLHDIYLEENTDVEEVFPRRKRKDGHWYAIDFNLAEIKTLQVHERTKSGNVVFKERFPFNKSVFAIPTFDEFIELIQGLNKSRQKNIGIYPEIKAPRFHISEGKDPLTLLMNSLIKYGYNEKNAPIFVQCFDPDFLKDFKKKYPQSPIRLIQLIADNSWGESIHDYSAMMTSQGLESIAQYAVGIGPWIPFILKSKLVEMAHEKGLLVHPYTLRDKGRLDDLIGLGVDGVFSDFPDLK